MTALSGLTTSFASLFAARLGVGVGEAVCAPAAASLIGDLFPSAKRGRATAVFMLGLPIGLAPDLRGGRSASPQAWGWRAAFFVAGLPGLARRRAVLRAAGAAAGHGGAAPDRRAAANGSALALLPPCPTLVWIIVSGALHNFNMYALATFVPALLTRHHGLSVRAGGRALGPDRSACSEGPASCREAGSATARPRDARRTPPRLRGGARALGAADRCCSWSSRAATSARAGLRLSRASSSCTSTTRRVYATIQDVVEPALRGTAMAVYFCAMYLMGASLGPVGTGVLSDRLAARAAAAAGSPAATEAFRAQGLHERDVHRAGPERSPGGCVACRRPRLRARPARADVLDGAIPALLSALPARFVDAQRRADDTLSS